MLAVILHSLVTHSFESVTSTENNGFKPLKATYKMIYKYCSH